jgi:hypothetical protein
MRIPISIISGLLSLFLPGSGQQDPAQPQKVLTQEQQALQQKMRETDVARRRFRADATQAFDSEMAREKAGDCPDAKTTYDFNVCFGEEVVATDKNLRNYEGGIRDLLRLRDSGVSGQSLPPGPAGPQLSGEQQLAEFDRLEQVWHSYLDAASMAAFHQFGGGTGGPSFEIETHLRVVRSHMRELDSVYGMLLRM